MSNERKVDKFAKVGTPKKIKDNRDRKQKMLDEIRKQMKSSTVGSK